MKATVERFGAQASKYRVTDLSWREAFYQSAMREVARTGRLVAPIVVVARPHCVDARGVCEPMSAVLALEQALEAAVAGGLLKDRRDVAQVTIHKFLPAGRDGLTVEFSDGDEPF